MPVVVQNDTGTQAGANAYNSNAEFRAYCLDRNYVLDDYDDTMIDGCIVQATDYIDTGSMRRYKGTKLATGQTTQFPRADLYNCDDELVEGVPLDVKRATHEYTFQALKSGLLAPAPVTPASGLPIQSSKEKVGPLEEAYTYDTTRAPKIIRPYPAADAFLRCYVMPAGNRVIR